MRDHSHPGVLLVEDNSLVQMLVCKTLEKTCTVTVAESANQTMQVLAGESFDLIRLDVGLPDGDGFELCQRIRGLERNVTTPILFLTGRAETEDKVRGFELGADDYIVKPIDAIEFRARITAKLKNAAREKQNVTPREMIKGPFRIQTAEQKVFVRRGEVWHAVELTAHQFQILLHLLENHERTVSREELLKRFWGADVHVSNRTIDSHIYLIRQALGEHSKMLQSRHGQGYRFLLKGA
jgi:DNA-binding response OmpR family regulator